MFLLTRVTSGDVRSAAWLPGASFKRKAEKWALDSIAIKERPWEWLAASMVRTLLFPLKGYFLTTMYIWKADGTALPSFASRNAEKNLDDFQMVEVIKNCSAIAYLAGSDTTVSLALTFILAMVLHPEVQARAQAEIDAVVGPARFPDFSDRDRLPYVEALFAETMRIHPVAPLSVPHSCITDDVYNGYYIPAGATVVGNIWAIMHDETLYPEPSAFRPERFVKEEGKELQPHPEQFLFGFGRRVCPGKYLAANSVWLLITYLLSTFDIKKPLDKDGKEVDPAVKYNDGLVRISPEYSAIQAILHVASFPVRKR
ncbi:hypothetical protein VNI00_013647 [Paramarasmius palmivorus]|uniref:Cytochrome P450 n=1 Tax=Paramarasmius palmivorus TaxID=297713 RepID=A0AAW0BVR1_9AGAR